MFFNPHNSINFFKIMLIFTGLGLFFLVSSPAEAQIAAKLEEMLGKPVINWADAAIFALEASDHEAFHDSEEAFIYAKEHNWLPKNAKIDAPARLDGISLLLMQAFGIKGGFMYSLAKNPHFAYRELVYKEIIQGRTDPRMKVSGDDFLFILSRILSIVDDTPKRHVESAIFAEADVEKVTAQETLAAEINEKLANIEDADAEVTSEGIVIRISNIQFLADSAELSESERNKVREIGEILKTIPGRKILVTGHTAMAGNPGDRQRISLERAQSVASFLIAIGARTVNEITVIGYGATRPIADNRSARGMALNRRVEIVILDN